MKNLLHKILSLSLVILSSTSFAQSNWTASNNGISANSYVNDFAQTANGDIYIIANVNGQGQLLKSTNNGSSWTGVTTLGLPTGAWAGSLFAKNNILFLGSLGLGSFLYSSTDNGLNWTAANSGLPANAYVNDFAQTTKGDIYIIANVNGQGQILKSTNNGSSWASITSTGLPSGAWAGSLFANNNTLFLGSLGLGSLLYTSTTGTTSIDEVKFSNSVVLFPNPCSGQINITSSNKIDFIQITNIVGQIVYEQQFNSNHVLFSFDLSGVYFVRVTADGQTTTKKIVVAQ